MRRVATLVQLISAEHGKGCDGGLVDVVCEFASCTGGVTLSSLFDMPLRWIESFLIFPGEILRGERERRKGMKRGNPMDTQ